MSNDYQMHNVADNLWRCIFMQVANTATAYSMPFPPMMREIAARCLSAADDYDDEKEGE